MNEYKQVVIDNARGKINVHATRMEDHEFLLECATTLIMYVASKHNVPIDRSIQYISNKAHEMKIKNL